MLRKLALRDFKSFRDETVPFSATGMTVLVGPNASGKSSVLEALYYAALAHTPTLPALPGQPLVRRGAKGFQLLLETDASSVVKGAMVADQISFVGGAPVLTKWVEQRGAWKYFVWDGLQQNPVTTQEQALAAGIDLTALSSAVPFPRYFDVDLRQLRYPLRPAQQTAASFDASQVVKALFELKMGFDPQALNTLTAKVHQVVPAVKALAIRREQDGATDKYGLTFNMTSGGELDASQVSEGTLLAVAILAAAAADKPTVLLIDDLDRGLHPLAQRELIKLLRASVKVSGLEIVCTTHSPYILSEFAYDEVRVLKDLDGESRCMSLADGPEASRWMKELDAGEYWSFVEHKLFAKSA